MRSHNRDSRAYGLIFHKNFDIIYLQRWKRSTYMDKNTIVTGLIHALENGQGELEDLEKLLQRAQKDIVTAKEEEEKRKEAAMKKRAEGIAELATRLLNDALTSADVAEVFNSYLRTQNIDAQITAESVEQGVKHTAELDNSINEFVDALGELFNSIAAKDKPCGKCCDNKKSEDPDDVINTFLKGIGLR